MTTQVQWQAIVGEFMSLRWGQDGAAPNRRMAWLGFADAVMRDGLPKRPAVLSRPASLPEDDDALLAALRTCKAKGEKAAREAREIGREFGQWAHAVAYAEARGAANLELCFRVLKVYADLVIQEGATEAFPNAAFVADHIRGEWQIEPLPLPSSGRWTEVALLANRRTDVMPTWLLNAKTERPGFFAPDDWGA